MPSEPPINLSIISGTKTFVSEQFPLLPGGISGVVAHQARTGWLNHHHARIRDPGTPPGQEEIGVIHARKAQRDIHADIPLLFLMVGLYYEVLGFQGSFRRSPPRLSPLRSSRRSPPRRSSRRSPPRKSSRRRSSSRRGGRPSWLCSRST